MKTAFYAAPTHQCDENCDYGAFCSFLPAYCDLNRLGKSLKPTIIASFSYNSFKRLANWSLEQSSHKDFENRSSGLPSGKK